MKNSQEKSARKTIGPDFNKAELIKAIEKYNQRDRRYGGVKEE